MGVGSALGDADVDGVSVGEKLGNSDRDSVGNPVGEEDATLVGGAEGRTLVEGVVEGVPEG